jgi:hypothetical protein
VSLRGLAAAVLAVALAVAGWFGWRAWQGRDAGAPVAVQELPEERADGPETVETVRVDQPAIVTVGATPMPERVATLGLLNKRNGRARDLQLKPGQAVRAGDVIVRLRACERTAPWEPDQLTGAFAQVDIRGVDGQWRRSFSGWLYKERPALNVVQHPIYDVWTKSCAMSFPASGPDTVPLSAPASKAKKSPGPAGARTSEPAPITPDNASVSRPR